MPVVEIQKANKSSEGISWLNSYDSITCSTQAINTIDNYLNVTGSCDTNTAIDASKVSNSIAIDKAELTALVSDAIESKKENYE